MSILLIQAGRVKNNPVKWKHSIREFYLLADCMSSKLFFFQVIPLKSVHTIKNTCPQNIIPEISQKVKLKSKIAVTLFSTLCYNILSQKITENCCHFLELFRIFSKHANFMQLDKISGLWYIDQLKVLSLYFHIE